MSPWLLCGLLTASLVVPASLTAQSDRASGRLTIDGDTIVLRHVLARRVAPLFDKDKVVTQVLITAQPVPAEALEDAWALIGAVRKDKVTGLQLEYEEDGRSVTAQFLSSRLAGTVSVSRSGSSAVPTELTATRSAGTFEAKTTSLEDYAVAVSATWSARVMAPPVVAEPTDADAAAALAHPAVKAWQAIARAIHAGDKAALLAVAPASIKAMASQPDFDAGFASMKDMTPLVTRYLRVTERNGKAIIEAEAPGLLDKQPKRGTITMVRDGDVWWVETMTF
jgi:hypothetical protein